MEHLMLPHGATLAEEDQCPCARSVIHEYDGGSFLDFPTRSRFKHIWDVFMPGGSAGAASGHVDKDHWKDMIVFLQTWLFFGILHELFGDQVPSRSFVKAFEPWEVKTLPTKGCFYLDTSCLEKLLRQWVENHKHLTLTDPLYKHLDMCVEKAWSVISWVRSTSLESGAITLRAVRPICALWAAIDNILVYLPFLDSGSKTRECRPWHRVYQTPDMSDRMISNGWCPADVKHWTSTTEDLQLLHYLSKMERTNVKDHIYCNSDVCTAIRYDSDDPDWKHCCPDKDCGELGIDDNALKAALESGYIGLLDIAVPDESDLDGIQIKVISSQGHRRYVALSHVWVEGLGNPFANSLPRCQVAYLSRVIQNLADSLPTDSSKLLIWVDTLCCPVSSPEHRNLCLLRMRQIYADATAVLILDSQLRTLHSSTIDAVEAGTRLVFSRWMRRLWTLQEGTLNQALWVQLKDRPLTVRSIFERLQEMPIIHCQMRAYLSRNLKRLRQSARIGHYRYSLEHRSVSVPTDEPLCLSTLLNIDQRRLLSVPEDQRMLQFWREMGTAGRLLPANMLFFHGIRLQATGFRWAPSSLLGETGYFGLNLDEKEPPEVAEITPRGLKVGLSAFTMHVPQRLSTSDKQNLDPIIEGEMDGGDILFIRHSTHGWYSAASHAERRRISYETCPPADQLLNRNNGTNTVVTTSPIEELGHEETSGACLGITGHGTIDVEDVRHLRSENCVLLAGAGGRFGRILEAAWRLCRDETLLSALLPFHKDTDEPSVLPMDRTMSDLPWKAAARLLQLSDETLTDPMLVDAFQQLPVDARRVQFCHFLLLFAAGRYGEITESFPEIQTWVVD